MSKNVNSVHWPVLVEIVETVFPKGECVERGRALVMLAYIEMHLNGIPFRKGEPIPREKQTWKDQLKALLIKNRSRYGKGSGERYWDSVVDVVEDFAKRNPDIKV